MDDIVAIQDEYICQITADDVTIDETSNILTVFKANFYLYLCLSIASLFSCIGGPLSIFRACSGFCHCVGAFAHIGVLIFTGKVIYDWASDCLSDEENSSVTRNTEMIE